MGYTEGRPAYSMIGAAAHIRDAISAATAEYGDGVRPVRIIRQTFNRLYGADAHLWRKHFARRAAERKAEAA